MQKILTLTEVAEILRVSPRTIYSRMRAGTLPAFKFGGVWRFEEQALMACVRGGVACGQGKPEEQGQA